VHIKSDSSQSHKTELAAKILEGKTRIATRASDMGESDHSNRTPPLAMAAETQGIRRNFKDQPVDLVVAAACPGSKGGTAFTQASAADPSESPWGVDPERFAGIWAASSNPKDRWRPKPANPASHNLSSKQAYNIALESANCSQGSQSRWRASAQSRAGEVSNRPETCP